MMHSLKMERNGITQTAIITATIQHLRQNPMQRRIWNGFSEKFGWRDMATSAIETFKEEDGLEKREDILTASDLIDAQEGRSQND